MNNSTVIGIDLAKSVFQECFSSWRYDEWQADIQQTS